MSILVIGLFIQTGEAKMPKEMESRLKAFRNVMAKLAFPELVRSLDLTLTSMNKQELKQGHGCYIDMYTLLSDYADSADLDVYKRGYFKNDEEKLESACRNYVSKVKKVMQEYGFNYEMEKQYREYESKRGVFFTSVKWDLMRDRLRYDKNCDSFLWRLERSRRNH